MTTETRKMENDDMLLETQSKIDQEYLLNNVNNAEYFINGNFVKICWRAPYINISILLQIYKFLFFL